MWGMDVLSDSAASCAHKLSEKETVGRLSASRDSFGGLRDGVTRVEQAPSDEVGILKTVVAVGWGWRGTPAYSCFWWLVSYDQTGLDSCTFRPNFCLPAVSQRTRHA